MNHRIMIFYIYDRMRICLYDLTNKILSSFVSSFGYGVLSARETQVHRIVKRMKISNGFHSASQMHLIRENVAKK